MDFEIKISKNFLEKSKKFSLKIRGEKAKTPVYPHFSQR